MLLDLQFGGLIVIDQLSILNNQLDQLILCLAVDDLSLVQISHFLDNLLTARLELLLKLCAELLNLLHGLTELTYLHLLQPFSGLVSQNFAVLLIFASNITEHERIVDCIFLAQKFLENDMLAVK